MKNNHTYIMALEYIITMTSILLDKSVVKISNCLSKAETEFIDKLKQNIDVKKEYKPEYVRQLKHRLLTKRRLLTLDLIELNLVLDKLQSL